jgi:hypothetical protein
LGQRCVIAFVRIGVRHFGWISDDNWIGGRRRGGNNRIRFNRFADRHHDSDSTSPSVTYLPASGAFIRRRLGKPELYSWRVD